MTILENTEISKTRGDSYFKRKPENGYQEEQENGSRDMCRNEKQGI